MNGVNCLQGMGGGIQLVAGVWLNMNSMPQEPFRILIAALGSYGDVHPFLALGRELQGRGNEVIMIMPAMYESLTRSLGLEFVPAVTIEQFERFSSKPELWDPIKGFAVVAEGVGESLGWYYQAIVASHRPGRTGLVMSTLLLGGRIAQETLGIKGVTVHLSPACFRSAIDPPSTPPLPVASWLPRWWNRLVYRACDLLAIDPALAGPVNSFRRAHGLPPVKRIFNGWIHSPDRVIGLFPDWFAPPPADWPRQTVLTEFPLYDEADVTPIDPDLEQFLKSGEPPIAFTPGSAMRHGREFFAEAIGTCQLLGRRGVFLSRHREHLPENLPPEIRHVEYAPFSRLLPRCAAIVHHGGIGTSAQGMAAGIPQLVVTMSHDQPDNAARLKRLGVSETLPARKFSAGRAATLLKGIMDDAHAAACLLIKRKLAAANPVARSAEIIEQTFRGIEPNQPAIR
jgi:rhamnosyltransferase subunit B